MNTTQDQAILTMKYTLIAEGCEVVEQPKGIFPRFLVKNPSERLQAKAFSMVMMKGGEREEWYFCREGEVSLWWH